MTYPRSHLINEDGGTYHVTSRCVRRAFLCGSDPATGKNFDHRKRWLEDQIHALSSIFAVQLIGYAVMSNHYHLTLTTKPSICQKWSDEQIADRWLQLFPGPGRASTAALAREERKSLLLQDAHRISELRKRLSSLSWFMRRLNEPLARRANQEDDCKGRFWEGRFKSQQILDEGALLTCLVYVDLNPIRAGSADKVEDAEHTSIRFRLKTLDLDSQLTTLNLPYTILGQGYTLREYIALLEWTANAQQASRPISYQALKCISKTSITNAKSWLEQMPKPGYWQRALGSASARKKYAISLGQNWIKSATPAYS